MIIYNLHHCSYRGRYNQQGHLQCLPLRNIHHKDQRWNSSTQVPRHFDLLYFFKYLFPVNLKGGGCRKEEKKIKIPHKNNETSKPNISLLKALSLNKSKEKTVLSVVKQ